MLPAGEAFPRSCGFLIVRSGSSNNLKISPLNGQASDHFKGELGRYCKILIIF